MRRIDMCMLLSTVALTGCLGALDGAPADDDQGPDCSSFDYRGEVYNCDELDRCTETDFAYRLACCECDPQLCNPDPSCPDPEEPPPVAAADSCMECHNGSDKNDYAGPGLSNPHPFLASGYLSCSTCHGGNPEGNGKADSHVPPPPSIGDDVHQTLDPVAYFNRLTLTGLDKVAPYTVNGKTYTALDYLQFVNPGDLRVVQDQRSCGLSSCHYSEHVTWAVRNPIATEAGFFAGTLFSAGVENAVPEHRGLYEDTAADYGFRAVTDPSWVYDPNQVGVVGKLLEMPEKAQYGDTTGVYRNPAYDSTTLANYRYTAAEDPQKTNRIKTGSPLATLVGEAISQVCGDCHAGSAGANNRYADYRSSGCTSCHMEYSFDGRSRSTDPNVNKLEPANPDAIAAPERPHVDTHQIRNVAKVLPNGGFLRGISDKACVGCHQGSNRTVLQYWGIRLDQNQDVTNGTQYPANPVAFQDTAADTRLYDPAVGNQTFNGRVPQQYLVFEDYDGDGRDDTPEDVHYEAGMGCVDCHGSRDLHGGATGDPTGGKITSREDQAIAIECESCHGKVSTYAVTRECTTYGGASANCATDRAGNALRNVTRDAQGDYWLVSRVDGQRHYIPQTKDTVVNSNKAHPITGRQIYTPAASYAMGRADGNPLTGIGPIQGDPNKYSAGFSHTDDMECVSCHASWTNNCVGCHVKNEYNDDPQDFFFSNITGERIVLDFNADFVYSNPVTFTLGVGSRNKITQTAPGMKMFYRYVDANGIESPVMGFSDRNGNGNNPNISGRGAFGALGHNKIMPHSIRGRVTANKEGPRYCVSCHLTENSVNTFGAEYDQFRTALANNDFANLDYNLLAQHIGQNPGNQLDSPIWVHMVMGLGSGLFLFDETGCPTNPLDDNANRNYCPNGAPATNFGAVAPVYDLDRVVEASGITNASNKHPLLNPAYVNNMRAGSLYPRLAGPFGAQLLQKMADPNLGLVLDSWFDANGAAYGVANNYVAIAPRGGDDVRAADQPRSPMPPQDPPGTGSDNPELATLPGRDHSRLRHRNAGR